MNDKTFKVIAASGITFILGVNILFYVLVSPGNQLGYLYQIMAISALFLGLTKPVWAVYGIIFASAYLDFLKRLMVVAGNPSTLDVAFIQAIPMALLVGAVASTVIPIVFGGKSPQKGTVPSFLVATLFLIFSLILRLTAGGTSLRDLGEVLNQGLYPFLLFLVPFYFRDPESIRSLLKVTLLIYIPVALYLLYQAFFGLAQFEYDYLETGLSIEARILWENGEALRPFSTMNGAGVVSVVLAIFSLLTLVNWSDMGRASITVRRLLRLSIFPLFWIAAFYTISRGGWFCGLAALGSYFAFRSKIGTLLVYGGGIVGFVILVMVSPAVVKYRLLDDVEKILNEIVAPDSAVADRAIVLGTAYDRFEGWANFTQRPEIWTPLGFAAAGRSDDLGKADAGPNVVGRGTWGHDITVDFVLKFGYLGCGIIGLGAVFFLRRLHSFIFSLPRNSLERRMSILCLALTVGILFGGLGNGAQLRVFPLNMFMYLFLGALLGGYLRRRYSLAPQPKVIDENLSVQRLDPSVSNST